MADKKQPTKGTRSGGKGVGSVGSSSESKTGTKQTGTGSPDRSEGAKKKDK